MCWRQKSNYKRSKSGQDYLQSLNFMLDQKRIPPTTTQIDLSGANQSMSYQVDVRKRQLPEQNHPVTCTDMTMAFSSRSNNKGPQEREAELELLQQVMLTETFEQLDTLTVS